MEQTLVSHGWILVKAEVHHSFITTTVLEQTIVSWTGHWFRSQDSIQKMLICSYVQERK